MELFDEWEMLHRQFEVKPEIQEKHEIGHIYS